MKDRAESSRRPNVLIIHADQHRWDCLGAYGNSDIRTPNIDALAADGVRFDNSFCPFPVCTPSRYSLLSSRYVHEHRGWTNHCTLPPGTETFPSILRDAGYRTKAVGKMHFTPTYLDVGFDEMVLSEQDGPGRWDDDYHRALMAAGLVDLNDLEDQRREYRDHARPEYWQTFGALPSNLPEEWHTTPWIGNLAVDTLEGWGPSGNLLMAGFVKPHHPFDPPQEWCDAYDPDALTLLPGWTDTCYAHDLALHKGYFPHEDLTEPALRRVMAYYYATIEQIDAQVGRMIALLKRKDLYDNTLIVYTSDHGEYMGYHHLLLKGGYMYEALTRVPLIIKYPGGARAGTTYSGLVNNVDVAPTILGQTGCVPVPGMRGLDLAENPGGKDVVFCEGGRGRQVMARTTTSKLIESERTGVTLFYDLEKDPCETTDLSADPSRQDEIQALRQAIADWRGTGELPDTYLDEDAPTIDQPNVPGPGRAHRDAIIAYYAGKMAEAKR